MTAPMERIRATLLSAGELNQWLSIEELEKITECSFFDIQTRLAELSRAGFTVERRLRSHSEWVLEYLVKPVAGGAS